MYYFVCNFSHKKNISHCIVGSQNTEHHSRTTTEYLQLSINVYSLSLSRTQTDRHEHIRVFAEPNCRRNRSHLSTGWSPTLHQRMQKIGEHLDSGDDTSICAAPVTSTLQFLPCGGVRSAGHLPSCLAEAWSTGTWPLNWRPGPAGPHHSTLSFTPPPGAVPRMMRLTSISLSNPHVKAAPSSQKQSFLEQHQIPVNSVPVFVPVLDATSISAPSSVNSARCLRCSLLSVLGRDRWEWSLSRPLDTLVD